MGYINEYSILSMMSRTSYQEGALVGSRGFYRGRRKATVFCYPLDDESGFDEIVYMYMHTKPAGVRARKREEVSWLIDGRFLPSRIGDIPSKTIRRAVRRYISTVAVTPLMPEDLTDVLALIDEWDRQRGERYSFLNHSYRDRAFITRICTGEIDTSPYLCSVYRIGSHVVGCSVSTRKSTEKEGGRNVYIGIMRKNLVELDGKELDGLSEFINWYRVSTLLMQDGGEEIVFNGGASVGGNLEYKKAHFPIYKIERRYFFTKSVTSGSEHPLVSDRLPIRDALFIRIKAGGYIMKDVAQAAGVPQPYLSNYIYGRAPLPYDALESICVAVGLGIRYGGVFVCSRGMFRNALRAVIDEDAVKLIDFCKATGINYSSMSSYMSGKRVLSNVNLQKSFDYLGLYLSLDDK